MLLSFSVPAIASANKVMSSPDRFTNGDITVNIDPKFNDQQQNQIVEALNEWNAPGIINLHVIPDHIGQINIVKSDSKQSGTTELHVNNLHHITVAYIKLNPKINKNLTDVTQAQLGTAVGIDESTKIHHKNGLTQQEQKVLNDKYNSPDPATSGNNIDNDY